MMSEEPTVALIGPGAIGTTIAAALHEVGRTPVVCGRTSHAQLLLRFDGGEITLPGPVLTDPAAIFAGFRRGQGHPEPYDFRVAERIVR